MTRLLFQALLVAVFSVTAVACGPGYLDHGKKIPASDENREVFDVVKAYHAAIERQDVESLRAMVSKKYHENGGTTDNPNDDYGYDKLMEKLEAVAKNFKRVHLRLRLVDLHIAGNEATVDYEYDGRVVLSDGATDSYKSASDFSRMRMARENGRWMIVGGL